MKFSLVLLCIAVLLVQFALCRKEDDDNNIEVPSANNTPDDVSEIVREMSADVICGIRQRGVMYPAPLRMLLHKNGANQETMDKYDLYRPVPEINKCGLDQNCIEKYLTRYMA